MNAYTKIKYVFQFAKKIPLNVELYNPRIKIFLDPHSSLIPVISKKKKKCPLYYYLT